MTEQELAEALIDHQLVLEKEYGKAFWLPDTKTLICKLTNEYVPIEQFKEIFIEMAIFIKQKGVEKFIFDKRDLRIFHQPSMEWYFVTWKRELLEEAGLKLHRKILPQGLPWFEQAVAAGRDKIKIDFPDNIIDQLDIQYKNSLVEAINE